LFRASTEIGTTQRILARAIVQNFVTDVGGVRWSW
jgi:hypothetical protein